MTNGSETPVLYAEQGQRYTGARTFADVEQLSGLRTGVPVVDKKESPSSTSTTHQAHTSLSEYQDKRATSQHSKAASIDHNNPQDWNKLRKWTATLILSGFAFLQPLTETMLAPVEKQLSEDLRITRAYDWLLCNSLILIGVGLGPLILAPLSEIYGRKPPLIGGSILFLIWNTACGASKNLEMMLAFRLLSGFGACVADAIAGGLLGDLWGAEERGKAFAIYMAAPLLGPAIGPICGAFISEGTDWRWVFWITSIASGAVTIVAVLFLRETYEPILQLRRTRASGKNNVDGKQTFMELMYVNLQRPFRMLATQLIVQILATYMAILYGTMFLFLFVYPRMWTERYGQSIRIGSLNYISAALGYIAGVNVAGYVNDWIYIKLKAHNNNVGKPEFCVPAMILGTALVPIGLLWWGWSGDAKLHWIMPNIGCLFFTAGCYICSECVSVYTIDTYTRYAASAVSTNLITRSIAAAFFPLFAPYMFDSLGFGIGATVLAVGFTIVGAVAIIVLWFYGEKIRARSTYCTDLNNN
ncbi:MFS general substrate transporter [Corynespora cassiicola Philippines]|uniref:MFS general substrate transporter n=1 Tax=Corynespora cassiicola Philippines TaxID=1448308 RepID=A0A2T2N6L1_CORCC|nr:MFS general substrate transporter [Corynespora cassiicola Philippines]